MMARHATIIDTVLDVYGDRWDVREYRDGPGLVVAIGWPAGRRGRGHGGPRVIVTPELLGYMARHRHRGGVSQMSAELPIGSTTIQRVRRLLGHNIYDDSRNWWIERAEDLLILTGPQFVKKHGKSEAAASLARQIIFGERRCRARGWWLTEPTKTILLADLPHAVQADLLDLPAGTIRRLRAMVRRSVGLSAEAIRENGQRRMIESKSGMPSDQNTRENLMRAARQKRTNPNRSKPGRQRLAPRQVIEARSLYAEGAATATELSELYGISRTSIHNILTGKSYHDIGGPTYRPKRKNKASE